MPAAKWPRRQPTADGAQRRRYVTSPAQEAYALLRPIVLVGRTPAARAQEPGRPARTLRRQADRVEARRMASLFEQPRAIAPDRRALPAAIRQASVDRKAAYPPRRPGEIATICRRRFRRAVSHHPVQGVLVSGLAPSRAPRRFPR